MSDLDRKIADHLRQASLQHERRSPIPRGQSQKTYPQPAPPPVYGIATATLTEFRVGGVDADGWIVVHDLSGHGIGVVDCADAICLVRDGYLMDPDDIVGKKTRLDAIIFSNANSIP